MYVYIHTYIYICICIYIHIYICICIYADIIIYIYIYIYIRMCVCVCVSMHLHIYKCICITSLAWLRGLRRRRLGNGRSHLDRRKYNGGPHGRAGRGVSVRVHRRCRGGLLRVGAQVLGEPAEDGEVAALLGVLERVESTLQIKDKVRVNPEP